MKLRKIAIFLVFSRVAWNIGQHSGKSRICTVAHTRTAISLRMTVVSSTALPSALNVL